MSTQEIKVPPLSSDELDLACQTLSEVGYVTFEQAIPLEIVEKIKDAFEAGHNTGQQDTDFLTYPFLDPRIINNPIAISIIEKIMGTVFFLPFRTALTPHSARLDTTKIVLNSGFTEIVGTSFLK